MIDSKTIKLIENSIEEIDEKREIPEELLSELINKNYFRLILPKSLNGVEISKQYPINKCSIYGKRFSKKNF